jgi:hypothetical protein
MKSRRVDERMDKGPLDAVAVARKMAAVGMAEGFALQHPKGFLTMA